MKTSWKLFIFLSILAVLRFYYAGLTELAPDEAYYWEWSRHLQLSYHDHPPMVAYLIFLSTWLGGHTEVWVRFQGVLVGTGISLVAYFMGRDLFKSEKAGYYSSIALNFVLLISVGCFIITPDTPQGLFGGLTLYFFYKAIESEKLSWWSLSGASLGLCMLSKYTAILLVPCIILTLATRPELRGRIFSKEFCTATGIAFFISLPILIWNFEHKWQSFSFQSKHKFFGSTVNPLVGFFDFIGTQFGLLTPFVFLSVISTMIYCFIHRKECFRYHFIFWTSAPILIFFCVMSFGQKIEGNWASLAYFSPLIGAVGIYLELKKIGVSGSTGKWITFLKWSSAGTSIVILCFVYIHAVTPLVSLKKRLDVTRRLHGWATLGKKVDDVLDEMKVGSPRPFVFGDRHQIISELSFYLRGNPQTYKSGSGVRYDHIKNTDYLIGQDAVYVATKSRSRAKTIRENFQHISRPVIVTIRRANRIIWEFSIIKCYHYKGGLVNLKI